MSSLQQPPPPPAESSASDMLNSWKEVAVYLKTTSRTVQRWEKAEGLPMHRHLHSQRHAVYAYKSELDAWWTSRGAELRETPRPDAEPAPASLVARRSTLVTAGVLVLIAVTAGLTWWAARPDGTPVFTQLTFDSGLTTDPALSPDGKLVAFASDRKEQGNLDIWIQQVAGGEARRLTEEPADESEPAFSPDGSRIAFRSEKEGGGIYVISILGGEMRLIARQGRRPRFSPDGTQIVYWIGDRKSVV